MKYRVDEVILSQSLRGIQRDYQYVAGVDLLLKKQPVVEFGDF